MSNPAAKLFDVEVPAVYRGPLDDARSDRLAGVFHSRADIRDPSLGMTMTTGEAEFSMVVEAENRQVAWAMALLATVQVLTDAGEDLTMWTVDVTAWRVGEPHAV